MDSDHALLEALRGGNEQAFIVLVGRYHSPMLRLASTFVPNRSIAEEVVQDTWLAVLSGLERFEGRSSLRTWLFRTLVNRARSVGAREHRTTAVDDVETTVEATRFGEQGYWTTMPEAWPKDLDYRFTRLELRALLQQLLDTLPEKQRQVVTLRDVEGLSNTEVCEVLGITQGNERVLLHRARGTLRRLLDAELKEG